VPVGYEVAHALGAPLDIFLVRKLGVPGYQELAMGAVASGGVRVLNDDVVHGLRIPGYVIDAVAAWEQQELARRERVYRDDRLEPNVKGRTVILVDDGLATGSTMQAAIQALRHQEPARIVMAVPAAPPDTCQEMRAQADDVVCAITRNRSIQSVFGTRIFRRLRMKKSANCSRAALRRLQLAKASAGNDQGDAKMPIATRAELKDEICAAAYPLTEAATDYDRLLSRIGDARFVLIGEVSHGTHDFYHERARITQGLIQEKGLTAVAVEGDWPDAYRVNRYVRSASDDAFAIEALADFRRFPTWMWRNTDVVEFIEWLRAYNDALSAGAVKAGFYGLDLYSLNASMEAVLQYLERVDPEAAKRARARYSCFDHFGRDEQVYGFLTGTGVTKSCQDEVISQLVDLRRCSSETAWRDGRGADEEEAFYAEQNTRLVKDAEEYYRSMFLERVSSWNLREWHMAETLEAVASHLARDGGRGKIVVWAHNSLVGDARVTEMGQRGELNIGQIARGRYSRDAVLIGQTTDHGTVIAASDWDGPAERSGRECPAATKPCSIRQSSIASCFCGTTVT
jgi:erythromycin esterase-like protein/predicted phosphoribosyltransferase